MIKIPQHASRNPSAAADILLLLAKPPIFPEIILGWPVFQRKTLGMLVQDLFVKAGYTQAWTGHCAIVPWLDEHRRPPGPFEIF